jgi:protoheme IX farnesyltransferase
VKVLSEGVARLGLWAFLQARLADYWELTKPGIVFLALVTTVVGFYLASDGAIDYVLIFHTLLGTALVAAGSGTLNQYIERDIDAKMSRTLRRPLPAGRILPTEALVYGALLSGMGLIYLAALVNLLTCLLGLATLVGYLFVYTPLKKVTWLSTWIGGFAGALPPMMGWAAVRGEVGLGAWSLFAILYLWQIPHFLAIAWMCRRDYARAGFPMLTVIDPEGRRMGRHTLLHLVLLVPASLLLTLSGLTGWVYFFGALALGLGFLACGVCLTVFKSGVFAKRLLWASILYLPLLLVFMLFDKMVL